MIEPPVPNPASSYAEAIARVQTFEARDDARIATNARTRLIEHGARTAWSVVLFHGLTNHPGQFVELAPQIARLGVNVFVPRMTYHGYIDRMATDIKALTAQEILRVSSEAADIAAGLGERVAVLGISMGGLQSAYLAQMRDDIATSVPIGPDFGILQLSHPVSMAIGSLMRLFPNLFLWWDPRIKAAQRPKTAYPRFSTHALAQTLRISSAVFHAAKVNAPLAARIATIVNRNDPAVNNEVTLEAVNRWRNLRKSGIEYHELQGLPQNHDIIDPDNPLARIKVVYPKLIEILGIHS
jgi:esterase/lipase